MIKSFKIKVKVEMTFIIAYKTSKINAKGIIFNRDKKIKNILQS